MEDFYVSKPTYEHPPDWIPPEQRSSNNDYNNDINQFLPRSVKIRRTKKNDVLGFNIRGGKEHHCGLYISKVMLNTDAHRLGLREGDQVLRINDTSFENIDHAEAVNILKSNKRAPVNSEILPLCFFEMEHYMQKFDRQIMLKTLPISEYAALAVNTPELPEPPPQKPKLFCCFC